MRMGPKRPPQSRKRLNRLVLRPDERKRTMTKAYSFREKPLIIFEIANNHSGEIDKADLMVSGLQELTLKFHEFDFGIKFQYRHLETFIHESMQSSDSKFVRRFLDTRLKDADFKKLGETIREAGLFHVATPFDEESVDLCVENKVDILKIASVSSGDWPLLEKIGKTWRGPVVASTAGKNLDDIEKLTSFLDHRGLEHALMHCVALYPTPDDFLALDRIHEMSQRFGSKTIGYSTHERPENLMAGPLALAAGARIFEKHVDFGGSKGNDYSANLSQLESWLEALRLAFTMSGGDASKDSRLLMEKEHLAKLSRFAWSLSEISEGQEITADKVQFSLANEIDEEGVPADSFSSGVQIFANEVIAKGKMIRADQVRLLELDRTQGYYPRIRSLLRNAGYRPMEEVMIEFSHHYGWDLFDTFGCSMITLVNDLYCKKWIISLKGQTNPEHVHRKKKETFVCVLGSLEVNLDGNQILLNPGDSVTVNPGVKHSFRAISDTVFEEISTTHDSKDSIYTDPSISENRNRKTQIRRLL